jgi:hypothetical protein
MKNSKSILTLTATALIFAVTGKTYATPAAPYLELGAAGPENWAVLDQGNFSISDPAGTITGNIGDVSGNVTTGGSGGVTGNVLLGTGASYSGPAPSGLIFSHSLIPSAALTVANAASTYYNLQTPNFTSAPSAGTVAAGVYDISGNWSPNGGTYNLHAGQIYIFNISGNFAPSTGASSLAILDSTPWDVLFNVHGNVQSSGGSSTFPTIDGIVLAHGQISLTPGYVDGEIISDTSINIASRGSVHGVTPVPEPTTFIAGALLLLPFAATAFSSRRKRVVVGGRVS